MSKFDFASNCFFKILKPAELEFCLRRCEGKWHCVVGGFRGVTKVALILMLEEASSYRLVVV